MDYDIVEDDVDVPGVQDAIYEIMKEKYQSGRDILEKGFDVKQE